MPRRTNSRQFRNRIRAGFTLIELLVVIAIIAILISVLLPALSSARKHSQATKCGANLHHVGQAMSGYLAENVGVYPPGYVYPDEFGNWNPYDADPSHPYGYIHWSYFLYAGGQAPETAFQCPGFPNGGAPRTNPGNGPWEGDQVDQNGQTTPNGLQDRQAERMAYTGNAAIFPRNKFNMSLSGGARINRFVNETEVHDPAGTILATEFKNDWRALGVTEGGSGILSKAHRPVNPFMHLSSGSNEYAAPPNSPGFTYGDGPHYTIRPRSAVENATNLIDNGAISELNAVGRHHPGGDGYSGGTANFLYADAHVERKSILQTVKDWEWGLKYYAITGANKVGPPWN